VQPRQIYASTLARRDRRWTRRRSRSILALVLVTSGTLLAALTVLAAVAPALT